MAKMNVSLGVTEQLLHTSNEITIILNNTIQKYLRKQKEYACFLNVSFGVTEQNLQIRQGFSLFSNMQKNIFTDECFQKEI